MLIAIITLLIGFALLWFVEVLHARDVLHTELSRKIIHLLSGAILIIWSFVVSWQFIIGAEVCFIGAVIFARKLKLFKSQYGVNRLSWGELFFPIGVILSILVNANRWVFIVAILHLALADSAAALVGRKYGKTNSYKVFGQKKSLIGSTAFFGVSVSIMLVANFVVPHEVAHVSTFIYVAIPYATTIVENLGVYGLDNLLIPLSVALLLK